MGFYKRDVRLLAGVVKNEGSFLTARKCSQRVAASEFVNENVIKFIQIFTIPSSNAHRALYRTQKNLWLDQSFG